MKSTPRAGLEQELRAMYRQVTSGTPPYMGRPEEDPRGDLPKKRRPRFGPAVAVVAAAVVVAVVGGVSALLVGGDDDHRAADTTGASNEPQVGLIVRVGASSTLQARVTGRLDINKRGCVTVDGVMLIAPQGARVSEDGDGVVFAGGAIVEFGSMIEGSGGFVQRPSETSVHDPLGCIDADPTTTYVQVDPER